MGSDARHQILDSGRKVVEIRLSHGVAAEDYHKRIVSSNFLGSELFTEEVESLTFIAFILHSVQRKESVQVPQYVLVRVWKGIVC